MKHLALALALALAADVQARSVPKPSPKPSPSPRPSPSPSPAPAGSPAAAPAAKSGWIWHTDAAAGFRVQAPPNFRVGREAQSNLFLLDPATKVTIMVAVRPHNGNLSAWEEAYRKTAKLPAWPARATAGKSGECRFIQGTAPTPAGPVALTVGLYVRDQRGFEITVAAPAEQAAAARKIVPRAIGLFEITTPAPPAPKKR